MAQGLLRKEDQSRRSLGEERVSAAEKKEVVEGLSGKSLREGERYLMAQFPEVATQAKEKIRPLGDEKTLVQFVASRELMEKLEELKALMAHQNFEGRMDILIEKLADLGLKKLKPQPKIRPQAQPNPEPHSKMSPATPAPGLSGALDSKTRSRTIPRAEQRKVQEKNAGQGCVFRSSITGKVCGSQHGLEFDHKQPFAWDGANNAKNLQILCSAHNAHRARQMGFGYSRRAG